MATTQTETSLTAADVQKGEEAIEEGLKTLDEIAKILAARWASGGRLSQSKQDEDQVFAYEYAHLLAKVRAAKSLFAYARRQKAKSGDGERVTFEESLALLFAAESLEELRTRIPFTALLCGIDLSAAAAEPKGTLRVTRSLYEYVASRMSEQGHGGTYGLGEEHELMRDAFAKFAEQSVAPLAEKIHREDLLIPEEIIQKLSAMGCFGLTIPEKYGGLQKEKPDNVGMVVVTEELSRASLGAAGSLITRPEILAKALLKGGTEAQKEKWLPRIASGEKMVAVAVTEPDYGSDVAGIKVTATPTEGGWRLNGVKTWCTFAGRADILMVLARTDPDREKKHRGLSVFVVEKNRYDGYEFEYRQPGGGKMSGRAISTIGYRGMHSFEVVFEDVFVPAENLIGGKEGEGKGFYLQMEGFAGGRLQTAARACGVMQAALQKALTYSLERKVFGKPIFDYPLTRYKLAKMAAVVQAARQFTYEVAALMDEGKGQMECSLVKLFASKISEWVTREAQQIHGGMGYAEEYEVSRTFVDARVFSIFEGAEEVLALRVVARQLAERKLAK